MSAGPSRAISYAARPDGNAPITVKSGMLEILAWVIAWPQPSTKIGGFFNERARPAVVMTTAPPPSVTRQMSRTVNG